MNEPNPVVIADRYEVVGILGEGGMGVVYKAHDRLLEITVALKMMREMDATTTSKMILRFQQEAKAAGRLNHANVAKVMDFGQLSGKLYMVMELLDGTPLSRRIEEHGRLSVDEALPLFIDICEGLVHAHKMGVLHRDLKPSNIILTTGDGIESAKIVDFGIAKLAQSQDLTAPGSQMGSPLYMSPEQAKGKEADSRSDIYSMGCLMYETLSGKVPIQEETALETLHKKTTEPAPTLAQVINNSSEQNDAKSNVPEELVEVVDRCLMINPDDRYKQMTDLLKALTDCEEAIAKNQELFLPEEVKHEEPIAKNSNKTILLSTVGVALLLILSATTWWAASRDEKPQERVTFTSGSQQADELNNELLIYSKGEVFEIKASETVEGAVDVQVKPAIQNVDSRFNELQGKKIGSLVVDRFSDATGSGLQFIRKDSLRHLEIRHTRFKSENMRLVAQFPNLQYLALRNIQIENSDLHYLEALKKLTTLDIGGLPNLDDDAFKIIGKLKSLETLMITDCPKLSNGYTSSIVTLPKLQLLSITRTPLDADGIKIIGSSKSLNFLDLCMFDTSAANIQALSQVGHAEHLKFRDVDLEPDQMTVLAKKPNLKALTLGGAKVKLTAQLIRSLKQMNNLQYLELAHCWLNPEVLVAIAELKQVHILKFQETHAERGDSLKYLMDMPELLVIRATKLTFDEHEFSRFVRNYSHKWKRQLDSALE